MKQSFFDKLRGKKPPEPEVAVETKFYNPLDIRIGSYFTINDLDYEGLDFKVDRIIEYRRTIGGKTFLFTDYCVVCDELSLRIRLCPMDEPDGDISHYIWLLEETDSLAYEEEFETLVNDDSIVLEDGDDESQYWRINDVKSPYEAELSSIKDENRDGKIEDSEVSRSNVKYWDFWRTTEVETVETLDIVIVEMDTDSGWFTIFRGHEINPVRIHSM